MYVCVSYYPTSYYKCPAPPLGGGRVGDLSRSSWEELLASPPLGLPAHRPPPSDLRERPWFNTRVEEENTTTKPKIYKTHTDTRETSRPRPAPGCL